MFISHYLSLTNLGVVRSLTFLRVCRVLADSQLIQEVDTQEASFLLDGILEWGNARLKGSCPGTAPAKPDLASCARGSSQTGRGTPCKKMAELLQPVLAAIDFERQPIFDLVDEREDVLQLLPMQRQVDVRLRGCVGY